MDGGQNGGQDGGQDGGQELVHTEIDFQTKVEIVKLKRLPDSSVSPKSELMSGRTSASNQNLVSIFPGVDNCLKATLCCWEAAVHTLD